MSLPEKVPPAGPDEMDRASKGIENLKAMLTPSARRVPKTVDELRRNLSAAWPTLFIMVDEEDLKEYMDYSWELQLQVEAQALELPEMAWLLRRDLAKMLGAKIDDPLGKHRNSPLDRTDTYWKRRKVEHK